MPKELALIKENMAKGEAFNATSNKRRRKKSNSFFYTPIDAGGRIWWSLIGINYSEANAAVTRTGIIMVVLSCYCFSCNYFNNYCFSKTYSQPNAKYCNSSTRHCSRTS